MTPTSDTEAGAGKSPALKGRFAPSPSGRMHLGNIFSAVASWASVKSRGGSWLLRIEDLDPQRSKEQWSRLIEDDLSWLGLEWDEGGTDGRGPAGPYRQSLRGPIYEECLHRLIHTGYCYPCICRRADLLATQAPHQSDGRVIYGGRCRPSVMPCRSAAMVAGAAQRLWVRPGEVVEFTDRVYGPQRVDLAAECGDFIVCRGDGAWSYQLAVVADDALMGVTEVVRGSDLLLSAAQQMYLGQLLGYPTPEYAHVPLLCNANGQRLSKRDGSLSMEALRQRYTPARLLGHIAHLAGQISTPDSLTPADLAAIWDWTKVPRTPTIILPDT